MNAMTCYSPETLRSYALGTLAEAAAQELQLHLATCPDCEAALERLDQAADTAIHSLRSDTQDAFATEPDCQRAVDLAAALAHDPAFSGTTVDLGKLGPYRLLEKLGEGGMGAVYKALHTRLDKLVAVKVLPADRMRDPSAVARFEREMKAVGRLEHPHIVRATDADEQDGRHYLVMEYVPGCDLSQLVRQLGPLPIPEACELIHQAALGLQHAHEHGLVHRDIKPSNLMLTASGGRKPTGASAPSGSAAHVGSAAHQPAHAGRSPGAMVKILDLGLALLDTSGDGGRELTASGQMMGTLDYMAPEQGGDSHLVDIRADIYSLGATLYKLLCGEAPFAGAGRTQIQKLMALGTERPQPLLERRPDIPAALSALVDRTLSKHPADRPATPADLAAALTPFAASADLARLHSPVLSTSASAESPAATITTQPHLSSPSSATPSVLPLPLGERQGSHHAPHDEMRETGQRAKQPAEPGAGRGSFGEKRPNASPPTMPHAEREAYIRRRTPVIAIGLIAAVLLAGIVIIIRDDKGQVVGRIEVPEGTSYSVEKTDKAVGDAIPTPYTAKTVGPASATNDPDREVAQTIIAQSQQSKLRLVDSDGFTIAEWDRSKPLPEQRFYISIITLRPDYQSSVDELMEKIQHLKRLDQLRVDRTNITANGLALLGNVKPVTLVLDGTPMNDELLSHLMDQPRLTRLELGSTQVTDRGLEKLAHLPKLKELFLPHTSISDEAIPTLVKFPALDLLQINNTRITTAGVVDLAQRRPNLSHVALGSKHLSGAMLESVAKTQWKTFHVSGLSMTDEHLRFLRGMKSLEVLSVTYAGKGVSDEGLAHLATIENLRSLNVSRTHVTDEGIEQLAVLKALIDLDVTGTPVTAAGAARLQALRPKCRIVYSGGVLEPKPD